MAVTTVLWMPLITAPPKGYININLMLKTGSRWAWRAVGVSYAGWKNMNKEGMVRLLGTNFHWCLLLEWLWRRQMLSTEECRVLSNDFSPPACVCAPTCVSMCTHADVDHRRPWVSPFSCMPWGFSSSLHACTASTWLIELYLQSFETSIEEQIVWVDKISPYW